MKLDPFDIEVLECKDNAADFMKSIYGIGFLIANVLDVLLTAIAVWGMGARELNPLIKFIPLWLLMIIKIPLALIIYYILIRHLKYLWVHKLFFWIYAIAIIWNMINILADIIY